MCVYVHVCAHVHAGLYVFVCVFKVICSRNHWHGHQSFCDYTVHLDADSFENFLFFFPIETTV